MRSFLTLALTLLTPPTMNKPGSGVITTTQDVDRLEFDWGKIHFLSEPAVTGAERFSFGIVELAEGKGHARHNHPGSEEIIYVVSGEGEQMVDDQPPIRVGPGASIYIPADVYHSTVNTGSETLKLIVVYSPTGPERLLREIPGCRVVLAAGEG
jgi:oxalate decarboxylase/phosphoglucose isomerase-like protein (cupin superfamily)